MLEVRAITAGYGTKPVLDTLSVRFHPQRLTALVGPNGCGKSTLLKAIMGFLPIHSGDILLREQPVQFMKRRQLARKLAYLPQDCVCPDYMTLAQLIELSGYASFSLFGGPSEQDRAKYAKIIETVGLAGQEHVKVNSLSGGQRQRAWIAMVLAQDTDAILLDEPVNHLDIKYQYALLALIRDLAHQHGKTVVVVLHDLNLTTAFADDVVMLRDGKVQAAGQVSETITPQSVQQVFDLSSDIFIHADRRICVPHIEDARFTGAFQAAS